MVREKAKQALQIETEWIRGYAKSYMPNEYGFSFAPSDLGAPRKIPIPGLDRLESGRFDG